MAVEVRRRRSTVEEYHRMGEAGILREDDRVELIDGEVVELTPIGSRHAACVTRLTHLLVRALGDLAIVSLYAQAGLREAWLVDLAGDVVEVFRRPGAGGYADVQRRARGNRLGWEAFPDVVLAVDDVLGPRS